MYFFKGLHPLTVQNTKFGLANFTGLGAAIFFIGLLTISNDVSLRTLKAQRWKSLRRWTYLAISLTGIHGITYQLIEKRQIPWVLLFSAIMTEVVAVQFLGFVRVNRPNRARMLSALPLCQKAEAVNHDTSN